MILREVTNLPSLPQNGEVFTWKVMLIVGSSTDSKGKPSTSVGQQTVSEIFNSPKPVSAIMSPAKPSAISRRSNPK